jgi:hypothetical protein
MGYYNKKQVLEYAHAENKKVEERKLSPLTPIEQTISQISKEEEVVGFFWVNISEGEKMKLEGKTFIRIDFDLYTDDRFAIDLYQAQEEGKTVSEIINQRTKEELETKELMESSERAEKQIKETIKNRKQ